MVPYLKAKGVGVMSAGPFSARLLTNAPLPVWLKEPEAVKAAARAAAAHCASKGVDIAKLALQFSLAHPDIATRRAAVEGLIDSGIVDRIANDGPKACRSEVRDLLGLAPVSEAA
jgi:hypothetical protein